MTASCSASRAAAGAPGAASPEGAATRGADAAGCRSAPAAAAAGAAAGLAVPAAAWRKERPATRREGSGTAGCGGGPPPPRLRPRCCCCCSCCCCDCWNSKNCWTICWTCSWPPAPPPRLRCCCCWPRCWRCCCWAAGCCGGAVRRSGRTPLRPPIPDEEPWWASRRTESLKARMRARASDRRRRSLRCHEGSVTKSWSARSEMSRSAEPEERRRIG